MTMTARSLVDVARRGLQFAGLLGSILAFVGSLFIGSYAIVFAVASTLAIGLDIAAIRTRWDSFAILAAIGKGIVVLISMSVLFIGGPTSVEPLVPSDVPFKLLVSSTIPSFLGALARRLAR